MIANRSLRLLRELNRALCARNDGRARALRAELDRLDINRGYDRRNNIPLRPPYQQRLNRPRPANQDELRKAGGS